RNHLVVDQLLDFVLKEVGYLIVGDFGMDFDKWVLEVVGNLVQGMHSVNYVVLNDRYFVEVTYKGLRRCSLDEFGQVCRLVSGLFLVTEYGTAIRYFGGDWDGNYRSCNIRMRMLPLSDLWYASILLVSQQFIELNVVNLSLGSTLLIRGLRSRKVMSVTLVSSLDVQSLGLESPEVQRFLYGKLQQPSPSIFLRM
ncbi:hypothetical protein HAX54_027592, partial [Datura stramonium]|nr:hypothetical protein [Datura stramonium]